jgi:site-specific DNA-adenine methylase
MEIEQNKLTHILKWAGGKYKIFKEFSIDIVQYQIMPRNGKNK